MAGAAVVAPPAQNIATAMAGAAVVAPPALNYLLA